MTVVLSADGSRTQVEGAITKPLPLLLRDRDKARLSGYLTHLDFYNGNQWPGLPASLRLRRLTVNYTQAIVDKTASYVLTGSQVSMRPHGESEEQVIAARAAELVLAEIAQANGLARLDYVTEIDCAVLGDSCFRVGWDAVEGRVIVTAPDAAGVFIWSHPTDPLRYRRLAHRYQLPSADVRATWGVGTAHDPEWVVEEWLDNEHKVWIGDDAKFPQFIEVNPYGFIPFIWCPNVARPKQWWGRSDVEPMIAVAKELNAEASRLSNIIELSGNPITVISGVEESKDIETFPGAIWNLPPEAKAALLDALSGGAVEQHLAYLHDVKQSLHDVSETPRSAFGQIESTLSGVAVEIEMMPLLQKVARKQVIRGEVYAARAFMALTVFDQFMGTNHAQGGVPVVSWVSPTPRDREREVTTESLAITSRLTSHESAIERLGDSDPDRELERIRAEVDLWRKLDEGGGLPSLG